MKLLKGFIRTDRADAVVKALEAAGAPGITLSREHGVGYGYDPLTFTLAPGEIAKAPEVVKVEVVCEENEADRLLDVLVDAARTGCRGDGIVFVAPVERAVKIRTGASSLRSENNEGESP
jgi:nitrogen regulatory protein P-II 1